MAPFLDMIGWLKRLFTRDTREGVGRPLSHPCPFCRSRDTYITEWHEDEMLYSRCRACRDHWRTHQWFREQMGRSPSR